MPNLMNIFNKDERFISCELLYIVIETNHKSKRCPNLKHLPYKKLKTQPINPGALIGEDRVIGICKRICGN